MYKRARVMAIAILLLALAPQAPAEEPSNHSLRAVIHRVQPAYPEIARRLNLEGMVMVRAEVAADGHVRSVTVVSGNAILVQAVTGAVREWVFAPGTAESIPLSITFSRRE